jgi:hypothetical protein
MNALAELQKRARIPANPAKSANQGRQRAADSQDSQDSQRVEVVNHISTPAVSAPLSPLADTLKPLRAHLLALATAEGVDPANVHRLHDADLAGCIGLDARQLAAYLAMLVDTADRHAGRVPAGDTAAMQCEGCGPVWIRPDIAEVLPVVDGWPRALGCPWCFVRKAGGYIPRPPVTCEGCAHFTPDTINPPAGMGVCGAGKGMRWPMTRHACADHSTRNFHDEA